MMWYEKSFRRHLCDMHIDDWDPTFLSEFDPTTYVKCLKAAKIQSAMLYFQSHVGLCYYPTVSGKMHNAFVGREDAMRRLVDLCHENGITVTGYYSLIYNTYEHDRHPEWRMLKPSGRSNRDEKTELAHSEFSDAAQGARYGLCCPNNPDYRAFVETQIREMAAYFPTVEGMFYDMLFWPHACYCEHCRARWAKEVDGDGIPVETNWTDKRWLLHMSKRREWMSEFAHWVTGLTKALLPGVSVEHNVAQSAGSSPTSSNEEVPEACDYAGGDLYSSIYAHSFACKFYRNISNNQPFELMTTRCAPTLATHTQLKSFDVLKSAMAMATANHGANLVIDAIDPVGTLDRRVYERIGEVFDDLIPYEPYMRGKALEEVGLYYSRKSKFSPRGDKFNNYRSVVNAAETLITHHIPFGVTGTFHSLDGYKVLMAPVLTDEDHADLNRIIDYVKKGGKLYFSGADCTRLLDVFFGAKATGRTAENQVYVAPTPCADDLFGHYNRKYPMQFPGSAPILDTAGDARVLATITLPYTKQSETRFASIHSNPPGIPTEIPAILTKDFGHGRVIWSAVPLECLQLHDPAELVTKLITEELYYAPSLSSTAPDDVEITVFEDGNELLLHTVLLNTKHTARRMEDFEITLCCKKPPKRLIHLPDGTKHSCTIEGNTLRFTSTERGIFATYKIEF